MSHLAVGKKRGVLHHKEQATNVIAMVESGLQWNELDLASAGGYHIMLSNGSAS